MASDDEESAEDRRLRRETEHTLELERAYVQALFCEATSPALTAITPELLLSHEDFESKTARAAMHAANVLYEGGVLPSWLAVDEHLRVGGKLDVAMKLLEEHWVDAPRTLLMIAAPRLRDLASARRRSAALLRASANAARGEVVDVDAIAAELAHAGGNGAVEIVTERQLLDAAAQSYVDRWSGKRGGRVPLGIPLLDSMFGGGVDKGAMLVVGARTHVGKTAFARWVATRLSDTGVRNGTVSLEDPIGTHGERMLAIRAHMSASKIRAAVIADHDEGERMAHAVRVADDWGALVDAREGQLPEILRAMDALVLRHKAEVLLVDYVQAADDPTAQDRRTEVARVAKAVHSRAKRLGVPLVLTSQLKRIEGRPSMQDLKESGDLEDGAEAILLLWKESGQVYGELVKNKLAGEVGTMRLDWDPLTASFQDAVSCVLDADPVKRRK